MARQLTLTEIADAIDTHLNFDGSAFRSSNFVILHYFHERETALTTKQAQTFLDQLNAAGTHTIRHDGK